jgi:hypothetical protein
VSWTNRSTGQWHGLVRRLSEATTQKSGQVEVRWGRKNPGESPGCTSSVLDD